MGSENESVEPVVVEEMSDVAPPDLESTASATEIYERLEAYESSGGDVDALLTSEDAEVVSAPERPARTDETEVEVSEVEGEDDIEERPAVAKPEPSVVDEPDDLTPDFEAPRAPKPDFDPEKLTEEGRQVYEYADRLKRYQQSHYAKKINSIIGDRKPDEAREILSRWTTLDTAPEFESVRTLIRGDSEYGSFAEALLNRHHPAHEVAVARYQRASNPEPAGDVHSKEEQLVNAVIDPDTGDVDPRRLASLLERVRENTLRSAPQQAPQTPSASSFDGWAAQKGLSQDDRLEMLRMWEEDNRPAFPDATRVAYFEKLSKRLESERASAWEATRVKEMQRHVTEGQPKPKRVGPGLKGQKIDWDAYDDPGEIAAAIESGKIDIDDPVVRRLANLD